MKAAKTEKLVCENGIAGNCGLLGKNNNPELIAE